MPANVGQDSFPEAYLLLYVIKVILKLRSHKCAVLQRSFDLTAQVTSHAVKSWDAFSQVADFGTFLKGELSLTSS